MANSSETDATVKAILNEITRGIQDEFKREENDAKKRKVKERKFDISLERAREEKKQQKKPKKKKLVDPDEPSQSVRTLPGGLPTLGKKG